MFKNQFLDRLFANPFGAPAIKRSRNLFGTHTTPREWKHGARDIPFGMGASSLYVDGANGSDSNDGESRKTAKKTIQEAVDTADSRAQIFIVAGTYAENVTIPSSKRSLGLYGEIRDSTIIRPGNGSIALECLANNCQFSQLYLDSNHTTPLSSFRAIADKNHITNCRIGSAMPSAQSLMIQGDDCTISQVVFDADIQQCIQISGNRTDMSKCRMVTTSKENGIFVEGDENFIYENLVSGFNDNSWSIGISVSDAGKYNTVFHNNLINNTHHLYDSGSTDPSFFENFYDDHTNIDNGFGIAKAPYAFTGGTDPRPVVTRNGWLGLSWADADQVADILANQRKSWNWNCLEDTVETIAGTWATTDATAQHLGRCLYNSSVALNDEIAIPFYAFSTDAVTLNCRCETGTSSGILTAYVDGAAQGTIDLYSGSSTHNAIKTLSITPARAGLNVLRLKVTGKNASSSNYVSIFSELWLS